MPTRQPRTPPPEAATLFDIAPTSSATSKIAAATQAGKQSAAPFVPAPSGRSLSALHAAMPACRGCDLYLHATQVVPGTGPAHSKLLLVGEQPGDQEDIQGLPFVGPAGKVLHRACAELDIDPETLFVTNAVKHFKFVQRGKLRLHQTPRLSEITACRPWLVAEIETLRPKVVLCLGASASKSLLGGAFSLTRDRGRFISTAHCENTMATYHPSAILRAADEQAAEDIFHFLKLDLALAHKTALAA